MNVLLAASTRGHLLEAIHGRKQTRLGGVGTGLGIAHCCNARPDPESPTTLNPRAEKGCRIDVLLAESEHSRDGLQSDI